MKLAFTEPAWADYLWFQEHDRNLLKRLNDIIKDALREPFKGLGKPEPLKGQLSAAGRDESTRSIVWFILWQKRS